MADSQVLTTHENQSKSDDDVTALESEVIEVLKIEETIAVATPAATVEPSISTETKEEEPVVTPSSEAPLEINADASKEAAAAAAEPQPTVTEQKQEAPSPRPTESPPAVPPSNETVHLIAETKQAESPATVELSTPAAAVTPATSIENSPEVQSSSVQEGVAAMEQSNESPSQSTPTAVSSEAAAVETEPANTEEQKNPKTPKSAGEKKFSFCKTS